MSEPLLSVKNMKKTFQANGGMFSKKKFVHAVNDVSFDIYPGETFSLVGESGCGKSTTGKLIDHLITPDSGEIWFEGKEISRLSEKEMRPLRSDIQMVFQDPYGSLNPRMKVQDLIGEPLLIHTNMSAGERLKKVHELLASCNSASRILHLNLCVLWRIPVIFLVRFLFFRLHSFSL